MKAQRLPLANPLTAARGYLNAIKNANRLVSVLLVQHQFSRLNAQ
mgnify:CR=1 FL=1